MSSFSLYTPGLSLYSIPVVWLVGIWPQRASLRIVDKSVPGGFNPVQPASNIGRLTEYPGVHPETVKEAERAEGAHKNSLEILPIWIGAVLAGQLAGLDDYLLNTASVAFIGARVLYNYMYLKQSNRQEASLRSYTWMASLAIPMTLFIKAASKIRAMKTA